jgi:hypothetical protein
MFHPAPVSEWHRRLEKGEARNAELGGRSVGRIALLKGDDNTGSTHDARAPAKKNAAYAGLL